MAPVGPPPRTPIKPRVKMRPFHWVKVPLNLLPPSFWNKIMPKGDLKLNEDKIEDLFAADATKVIKKKKKEQPKTLLDAKRGQNLGIFMSGFKIAVSELDRRLHHLPPHPDALPVEYIISLRKLAPTPEEYSSYKKYPGDKSQLSDIDQFLMRLMEIPNLKARLDLLLTVHEFPLQFEDLAPEIELTLNACKQLLKCPKFEDVLHYVLSIGNYVNGGTNKGACHGFQLKSLVKLADARGRDKKTTLLDFLVMTLREKQKQLLSVPAELDSVPKALEASVKGLSAEVEVLARDLLKIDRGAKKVKEALASPSAEQEEFFSHIDKFVATFEEKLVKLHADVKETETSYKDVLVKYGERPTTDSEEIFGYVATFVARFKESVARSEPKDTSKGESYAEKKKRLDAEKKKEQKAVADEAAKSTAAKSSKAKASQQADAQPFNPFAKTPAASPTKKGQRERERGRQRERECVCVSMHNSSTCISFPFVPFSLSHSHPLSPTHSSPRFLCVFSADAAKKTSNPFGAPAKSKSADKDGATSAKAALSSSGSSEGKGDGKPASGASTRSHSRTASNASARSNHQQQQQQSSVKASPDTPRRNIQVPAKAEVVRPEPDMPDREGGYGGFHRPKHYDVNAVNPFKQQVWQWWQWLHQFT